MFLDAIGDIAELAVTVWSIVGPHTSASELLSMLEIMDEIDAKFTKIGFEDGVFAKAKIKIMLWCCNQEWFPMTLRQKNPEWPEFGSS